MSSRTVEFDQPREHLMHLLREQGIREDILDAMRGVAREAFVPESLHDHAYEDTALPIGLEQTISQPFIVALMAQSLQLSPEDRVLEVGAGSGYAAAVLALLARDVYTVERHQELARTAIDRLAEQGFNNIHVRCGDGSQGWPEQAPFDAITVAAAGPEVPTPLLDQLAIGGRLVMPLGEPTATQTLVRIRRLSEDDFHRTDLASVRFVPLIGSDG